MTDPNESFGHTPGYALGHSERELERLGAQARLVDPITRGFFRDAGIATGMRVLDVGSGAGDTAFLAASMVGEKGEIVGVDRSADALAVARSRAKQRDLTNVTFHEGDPTVMSFDRPFDAVVGRYVLLFQKDPAGMLRKLGALLRPGGVIVFHEPDWSGVRSYPTASIFEQCNRWVTDTLRLTGADWNMGIKLHSAFLAAGLPAPTMKLEAVVGAGERISACLELVSTVTGIMMPEMERVGVTTAAEAGLDTLDERIKQEATALGSVIVWRSEIGAWTRV